MRVDDVMVRDPVVVAPATPLARCRELLGASGFRHLPVVDGDGRVLGILSDVYACNAQIEHDTAGGVMVPARVVVAPSATLYDALDRCAAALQETLLVAEDGRLVGVFTEHDACALAAQVLSPDERVRDYASTGLVCVDVRTPATESLERMRRSFLRHLVVLDDLRLHGILSMRDLVRHRAAERRDLTAGDCVSGPVRWTTGWDTPMREAARVMAEAGVGCLPIVHPPGMRVDAVVSRCDVLRALLRSGAIGEPDRSVDDTTLDLLPTLPPFLAPVPLPETRRSRVPARDDRA